MSYWSFQALLILLLLALHDATLADEDSMLDTCDSNGCKANRGLLQRTQFAENSIPSDAYQLSNEDQPQTQFSNRDQVQTDRKKMQMPQLTRMVSAEMTQVTCSCKTQNAGAAGHHQFTCTDGTTTYCASKQVCSTTARFIKGALSSGCQANVSDPADFMNSSKAMPTLVFFAGLEGSGHHLLEMVMEHVPHHSFNLSFGWHNSWNCGQWSKEDMDHAIQVFKNFSNGSTNVFATDGDGAYLSYPCAGTDVRQRMYTLHPRLEWLREAAHRSGVALRVMFLHRDVTELLASGVRRNFSTAREQTDVLISNSEFLSDSINMLQPQECACFRYGNMESMESAMIRTFGVDAAGSIAKVWDPVKVTVFERFERGNDTELMTNVNKLRSTQQVLNMACDQCGHEAT